MGLFAIGVLVGVALVFALLWLRSQLGHDEFDTQLERSLRDGWPLLFVPLAVVLLAFDVGVQRTAALSLCFLAWMVFSTWRFVRRDRRLGSVLVKVPRSRYAAVQQGAVSALSLLLLGWLLYRSRAYDGELALLIGVMLAGAAQNLMLARAGVEIREGGVCSGFNEWRWEEVRRWWWRGSNLRPLLVLDTGLWSPAECPVPEYRRAEVDAALTKFASAQP